jgi:hypothetical protein
MELIFEHRVTKRTPGSFRTRVVREGVIPSLHVDYKSNRIKQYFKECRALRTELTVHNPRDFGLGRSLANLPALRELGFQTNRRVLRVQTTSQDFCDVRRIVPRSDRSPSRGRPAGFGFALWRPESAGVIGRVGAVSAAALWISQS